MSSYENHTGLAQSQGAVGVVTGAPKPRVRARRGQATDPHSIAERLRRERIAERMKALQELVPNSNKTDKASMLDEIIEYVKFLQLQVKVLSMSRMGGAVSVLPLVSDLPPEEAMLAAEHEVAGLMEEDMGTAMQFLQSKGLCLMPIALATGLSIANSRAASANQLAPDLTNVDQMQMGSLTSYLTHNGNSTASNLMMSSATGGT